MPLAQEAYRDLLGLRCFNCSQELDAKDLLGKVVVVLSWRETDVLSLAYLEKLKEWARHYHMNMVVVGLYAPKFDGEKVEVFLEALIAKYELELPVFMDEQALYRKIYGLKKEPGLVVFDQLGRRRSIGFGNIDLKATHELCVSLMNQGIQAKLNRTSNTILLGRKPSKESFLKNPSRVAKWGEQGLVISDTGHHRIVISSLDGKILNVVGSSEEGDVDGDFRNAQFRYPSAIAVFGELVFVADSGNHKIKCLDLASKTVRSVVGTGLLNFHQTVAHRGGRLSLAYPMGLSMLKEDGKEYLLISNTASRQILKYDIRKDEVHSYIGNGRDRFFDDIYKMCSLMQPFL